MLTALRLKSGKFLYVNFDYVETVDPDEKEEFCDLHMASGKVWSVEGSEHEVYAMYEHSVAEWEGQEEDE